VIQDISSGRRVSLEEARELSDKGVFIHWRPEALSEKEQYCIAFEEV
jgi:hypothetical protein